MDHRELWAADAVSLAQIGAALVDQDLRVRVVLPSGLLRTAVAAWSRDDDGEDADTDESASLRGKAAALALIGLAAETRSVEGDGDIALALDAWQIAAALDAAEEVGLVQPGQRPSPWEESAFVKATDRGGLDAILDRLLASLDRLQDHRCTPSDVEDLCRVSALALGDGEWSVEIARAADAISTHRRPADSPDVRAGADPDWHSHALAATADLRMRLTKRD